MSEDSEKTDAQVETRVELTGSYQDVASVLGKPIDSAPELDPVLADAEAVLQIVGRTGGATKSRIADELPSDVTAELDSDAVIHILRVLELYSLVTLDGNTWRPGPALSTE